ncbi:Phospholipid-transporting ATPase [Caligus rogercresseyi]|uniref:Phospholipid-transporting ATPase n=1 Tax=Caligus rogercresseyi TaxID=217165 RepID=A0A7T8KIJ8_CALRO|nr:Phospholipid-transporting ATPase [Caligus rogercresseyi]
MIISESTVLVTNLQILFDVKYFDPKLILSIMFSLVGFGAITMIIQRGHEYGVYETLFLNFPRWTISALIVLSCLLPKFFGRSAYYFLVANEDAIKETIKKTVRFDLSMTKV